LALPANFWDFSPIALRQVPERPKSGGTATKAFPSLSRFGWLKLGYSELPKSKAPFIGELLFSLSLG
jgi:hypothetical protein